MSIMASSMNVSCSIKADDRCSMLPKVLSAKLKPIANINCANTAKNMLAGISVYNPTTCKRASPRV